MKHLLPLLALVAGPALAFENAVPVAFPADRYQKLAQKSPFALATAVAPPVVPQASFAANWFLTAVGRDPDGRDFVTVKAQDGSVHFSLSGSEADPGTGVSLASVNWSDTWRKSTAIIKRGTETAELFFGQEDAPAAAPQPNGAPRPVQPGQPTPLTMRPGNPGTPQTPVVQPRIALPRPSTAPVIPLPVVAQPPPVIGNAPPLPANQPAGQERRRIRTIAAPQ